MQLRTLDLRTKNIRIEVQNRGILPAVRGDPNQLLQVFFQIISNAVDAMEATGGGVLTIRTERERANVVIEFSDSGPGLSGTRARFRSVLYHQARRQRFRPWPEHLLRDYSGTWRHDHRLNRVDGGAIFRIELPAVLAVLPQLAVAVSPVARMR